MNVSKIKIETNEHQFLRLGSCNRQYSCQSLTCDLIKCTGFFYFVIFVLDFAQQSRVVTNFSIVTQLATNSTDRIRIAVKNGPRSTTT